MVGHRLVIEARDDMQVGVESGLIVPAERVAVGSEPLVQLGSCEKQKFPCRRPLLGGQVERRSPVNFRDDGAAAWKYAGRITRVSGKHSARSRTVRGLVPVHLLMAAAGQFRPLGVFQLLQGRCQPLASLGGEAGGGEIFPVFVPVLSRFEQQG